MDVLAELVARITADATELKKALTDSEKAVEGTGKKVEKETKSISDQFKDIGKTATIMGAAITASMGMMVKAAIDEEINIKRLAGTMANVGVAYDNVKHSLEGVISATQRKTGVADNEQRDILNRLILVTNDYDKALKLLPTVLDLAAAGEMNAATAATYLGKAYLELEQGAESVSVRFGQASIQFKNMEDIQRRVANQAENMANPFKILQATMGDLSEVIGTSLIPTVKGIINPLVDITLKVQQFIQEQPELTKALTTAALAVGVLATAIGVLALSVKLLGASLVPVIAALAVIGGLTAAVIAVGDAFGWWGKQVDEVVNPLKGLEDQLKLTTSSAAKLAQEADAASGKAIKAFDKLGEATVEALKRRNKETEDAEQESLSNRLDAAKEHHAGLEREADKANKAILEKAKEYHADLEREADNAHRSILRGIEDQRDAELDSIQAIYDGRIKQERDTIASYEREANAKLRILRSDTNEAIKGIQSEIDAINAKTEAERESSRGVEDANRIAQLQQKWMLAKTENNKAEMARLDDELAKAIAENQQRGVEVARRTNIKILQDKIEALRDSEKVSADNIKDNLDAQKVTSERNLELIRSGNLQLLTEAKKHSADLLTEEKNTFETLQTLRETDAKAEIAKLKETAEAVIAKLQETAKAEIAYYGDRITSLKTHYVELNKQENIESEARKLLIAEDQTEVIKLLSDYNSKWMDAGRSFGQNLILGLESEKANIQSKVTEIMGLLPKVGLTAGIAQSAAAGAALDIAALAKAKAEATGPTRAEVTEKYFAGGFGTHEDYLSAFAEARPYATGGIVPGAIGEPQLAMVHGGETITPAGKSGITIVFEGPVYGFNDFESKVAQAVKDHAVRGGFHGVF